MRYLDSLASLRGGWTRWVGSSGDGYGDVYAYDDGEGGGYGDGGCDSGYDDGVVRCGGGCGYGYVRYGDGSGGYGYGDGGGGGYALP